MSESNYESVQQKVNEFYNELPFNYTGSVESTAQTMRDQNQVASAYPALHEILQQTEGPVLDVGCGAGWFVNTVAHHYGLEVRGIDLCDPALERARSVAAEIGHDDRVSFRKVDLFRASEELAAEGPFPIVNTLGVLHHTHDCRAAVDGILDLVAPGGWLHIGLYHLYGREPFLAMFEKHRQALLTATPEEREVIEGRAFRMYRRINPTVTDSTLARSWFRDQVIHPHETQHTVKEVHDWLTPRGFECLSTSINAYQPPADWADIFEEEKLQFEISERMNVKEGKYFPGFFVVLAQKKPE